MDARQACEEMELSAYELSEAERLERQAKALRLKALRRTARVHSFFKDALEEVETQKGNTNAEIQDTNDDPYALAR